MAFLPRPVTMMIFVSPAATASSMTYWMMGLSTRGSISLGCALVAGRKRVPRPAAGKTALRIFIGPFDASTAPATAVLSCALPEERKGTFIAGTAIRRREPGARARGAAAARPGRGPGPRLRRPLGARRRAPEPAAARGAAPPPPAGRGRGDRAPRQGTRGRLWAEGRDEGRGRRDQGAGCAAPGRA